MKKILLCLLMIMSFCFCQRGFCLDVDVEIDDFKNKQSEVQKKISQIGFHILNANRIEQRMAFYYSKKSTVNAYTDTINRKIVVYKGLFNYIESDDELAGILAHEISHGVDSYNGICRGAFTKISYAFVPRKYERLADKRAVDYMVKAGYNPVAFIVIMNKFMGQRRYEIFNTHPLTSRRMAMVYEYIFTKYPEFLADNKYKDNVYYQNFLLTSTKNRTKFQQKYKSGSKATLRYQ